MAGSTCRTTFKLMTRTRSSGASPTGVGALVFDDLLDRVHGVVKVVVDYHVKELRRARQFLFGVRDSDRQDLDRIRSPTMKAGLQHLKRRRLQKDGEGRGMGAQHLLGALNIDVEDQVLPVSARGISSARDVP